jgi:DNA repair ATPase RecN
MIKMKLELNAKTIQIIILIILLSMFVGSGITGFFIYGDYNVQKVNELNEQLKSLQTDYSTLKSNYENCTENLLIANTQNENINEINKNLTKINSECQANLSNAQIIIADLQNAINKSQYDYNSLAEDSASRICCIIKKNYNPNIKYFLVENNSIICSDIKGTEFNC